MEENNLITLYESDREITYDEYKELCECNDWEIHDEGSPVYYDVIGLIRNWDWDDFKEDLKTCKVANRTFAINGTVGAWDGTHEIYPEIVTGLYDAIMKCYGRSILDLCAYYNKETKKIEVVAKHHDGRNHFELAPLSQTGEEIYNDYPDFFDYEKDEYIKMTDNWFENIEYEDLIQ